MQKKINGENMIKRIKKKLKKITYDFKVMKYFFNKNKYLAITTLFLSIFAIKISNLSSEYTNLISIIMSFCTSLIFLCVNVILGNFFNKRGKIPRYKDSLHETSDCILNYFGKYFGIDYEILENNLFSLEEEHLIVHCKIQKSQDLNKPFKYIYTRDQLIKTGLIISFDKNSRLVDPIKNEYVWIRKLKKDLLSILENIENIIVLTSDEKIREESLYIKNLVKISIEDFVKDDGKKIMYNPNKFMVSLDTNSYYIKSYNFPSYELYLYFEILKKEYFNLPLPLDERFKKSGIFHLGRHKMSENIKKKYIKLFK